MGFETEPRRYTVDDLAKHKIFEVRKPVSVGPAEFTAGDHGHRQAWDAVTRHCGGDGSLNPVDSARREPGRSLARQRSGGEAEEKQYDSRAGAAG